MAVVGSCKSTTLSLEVWALVEMNTSLHGVYKLPNVLAYSLGLNCLAIQLQSPSALLVSGYH